MVHPFNLGSSSPITKKIEHCLHDASILLRMEIIGSLV
jgi:hypothetical protein